MTSADASSVRYDVVVVGGGHNGLVSAAYLARAGLSVLVLERLGHTGGAAVSAATFPGRDTRLSRYSYLVSLMPEKLMADLGLDVTLVSRPTASYTPVVRDGRPGGLLVERPEGPATAASFRELTGSDDEYAAWREFYADVADLAHVVAPTLLEPLPTERALRDRVDPGIWRDVVTRPLGEAIERRFRDDTVRGVVATDALIGTFASLDDPSLAQNRCFVYHLIGNGTGEWRVPVGGMGAVTTALARAATQAGADIRTGAGVSAIRAHEGGAEVDWHDGERHRTAEAGTVLANVAPWVLRILLGEPEDPASKPVGSQLKINVLLDRLPRLRSGVDPAVAFAGTLHLAEDYSQLAAAHADAAAGHVPAVLPGEVYCHSLTDPSILGDAPTGTHTLTYFGLHTPATLFDADPAATKAAAVDRALASLDEHLLDPISSCVARDATGAPCIEAKIPQDIERDLAMPGGHIFHGDLDWPWAANRARLDTPAQQWGVQTDVASVLLCGSGARRGGAVSGIAGHNAAQAVLASR
ncbi:FAD-dependent oxidoreductase [Nocardioides sp. zg-579]|uniref:Pyridine nucleotide-disulfide oxidoreductase domain-containing protein 2 n=1 Tax=Nocardioides marmotae TaxID=2663857 RepID=A0A6I3JG38_9ACTN|nr:NAD(P)/FAD-dependent oxidoreductase [Nocardioides marmotae]MCR6033375.1 FAD-dependent oxidoreductase [Gordonia jinghuaiqii]MTB97032.1 FAD-dependent oxidoreductase [Nocardioides marmotae]QKE00695.1 NAD(P)/FAD-dependent oxidoreductase [Nocardioides marmotae]